MPNNESDVRFREIDLSAEARRIWGPEWNAPEPAYEFSNGRKFVMRTGDSGIYSQTQSLGNPLSYEYDDDWALEDGGELISE